MRVGNHALHGSSRVVALSTRCLSAIVLRDDNCAAIWVEKKLGRVEPQPASGLERSAGSESIDLTRFDAGHEYVPIVICTICERVDLDDAGRAGVVHPIEKQQFDSRRTSRKH
jgi:hypothetical protein